MTGNNPKSLRFQAACVRHAMTYYKGTDLENAPMHAALEYAAVNLDKMADAIPAIKAVMTIYEIFPDASDPIVRDLQNPAPGKSRM